VLVQAVLPAAAARAESPQVLYMLHCQGCHLPDGGGSPGSVPSLTREIGRFLDAPGGRAFLVRVPGSFDSPLDDAELASVLNWMIGRFDPGVTFVPYTAHEVAGYRGEPLTDVEGLRAELLDAIARRELSPPGPSRASREADEARESDRSPR